MPQACSLLLIAICSIGFTVEYCWGSGETVLIPYLTAHEVPKWIVSTIYLANPTLGLFLQPRLGTWSDGINRRLPFVVGLTIVALLGIAMLITAIPLTNFLLIHEEADEEETYNNKSYARIIATALAFVGFGMSDICFDCLLIPGRSLLDDIAVPCGISEEANALFTGFQLAGRLIAMLLGSSAVTFSGLYGTYKGDDKHFNACFSLSAFLLMFSLLLVLLTVEDKGSTQYEATPNLEGDKAVEIEMDINSDETDPALDNKKDKFLKKLTVVKSPSNKDSSNIIFSSITRRCLEPDASILLCTIQVVGWVGVCAQSFFWTSWRGEKMGCIDLAIQSAVGVITSGLLPIANSTFGTANVWCGSELMFHLSMMSVALVVKDPNKSNGFFPRLICALSGIGYAVHATNGLIVAADIVADPSKRARTIAMVNNTLPMGQLITALLGGTIAQLLGGFEYVFICFGLFGNLVTAIVWIISVKRHLFSPKQKAKTELISRENEMICLNRPNHTP